MAPTLSQRKRAAIVQAAIEEFHISGYNCSNMDAIAARAKVSKRTVYNHFSSKEALFGEISMQLCESITNVVPEKFDAAVPLRDQLIIYAERKIALCTCPEFVVMAKVTLPERVRNPELAKDAFERIRSGDTGFDRWLESAMDEGMINRTCPLDLRRQFSALLLEFVFWPQFFGVDPMPTKKESKEIAATTVDIFLNGCAS
ncbi:TetR family transcriptional regulator [Oceaniferula spumae]|uniref:TetR family transcriptional regulator n=1 Tax=Oceaniferula spumae TaxID=2979115 RepID=A0AAT9FQE5_9BACT